MKKHISTSISIFAALVLAIVVYGCKFNTSGTWKDDNINDGIRNEINALNKKLLQHIKANDVEAVKQMMSKPLLDSGGTKIDTLVHDFSPNLVNDEFRIMDEFYVKNSNTNVQNHIFSDHGNIKDYEISYEALNKEMYTSLITPKTPNSNGAILICYGKYDSGWKINIIYLGIRKVFGKTAPEYYEEAKDAYKKGEIINAADLMSVAKELARPLSDHFKYTIDDTMKNFYTKLISEGDSYYHFPITANISTKPQIFQVLPQIADQGTPQGIFPVIRYKTNIPLTDTIALKAEKDKIQTVIGSIFKGIDTGNDYIIYQACDKIPAKTEETVHRYGFLEKQK